MQPISLRAEEVFRIGSFAVTNAALMSALVFALLSVIAIGLRRRLSFVPGAVQNLIEIAVEGALGLMESVLGNRRDAERYFPLVFTIFIFVISSNWLGLLPGVGSLIVVQGGQTTPLLRSPASDLNFTLALALIAVTFVNAFGVVKTSLRSRLSVFLNFNGPIQFFVGLLEFVSEIAKIISFSFRLFGNVFAGEVLLAIVGFLVPYVLPLPFMFLEVFVGFIQAFIFAMLTLVFISAAISHKEEENNERHGSVEPRRI